MKFAEKIVKWSRKMRSKYLGPLGKFFSKIGIKATYVTVLAFIFGAVAVYFLFRDNFYFVLFGVLHLLFDGLDGVIARATKPTKLGAHLDNISDRAIIFLVLIKSYFFYNDYFILVVLGMFVLHHLIYSFSGLKGKVVYCRFLVLVLYFLGFYVFGYFIVGVLSLFGLSLQLNDYIKKKFTT